MKFIADFHIHSHYSRATSKKLNPENIEYWAKIKGINVVGTGDSTHPGWVKELQEKLEPAGNGLYKLKAEYQLLESKELSIKEPVYFILSAEISNIYKKFERVRKVHNVCVFPDFETVIAYNEKLARIGNIISDGRPILGLDSQILFEMLLETNANSMLIPAHIWTPWFSVLGSKSGFDTIDECYGELTKHIFAVETGLSSDPPMNRTCSFLDKFRLVSNSDAHSPEKLGREANIFDTELSYMGIYNSLKNDKGFLGTIEFFPEEGKYHYDGHRACDVCFEPQETMKHNGLCPVCNKPVTKGVAYRVAELADRKETEIPKFNQTHKSITPLPEILAEIHNVKSTKSKKVVANYFELINSLGSEFHILLDADLALVKKKGGSKIAEGIKRLRTGQVHIKEGYDGEFGRVKVFNQDPPSSDISVELFFGKCI